jgi:CheY-like chemotaxis protein
VADSLVQRGHAISVLFVDDDPDMRTIYGGRLLADGFEVRFAADGHEALIAANRPPDLVLLDMRMPGMDGLEVLRRLKDDATTAGVPVVMLSNEREASSVRRAQAMGAAAWWAKCDVVPAELSRRVGDLLGCSPGR